MILNTYKVIVEYCTAEIGPIVRIIQFERNEAMLGSWSVRDICELGEGVTTARFSSFLETYASQDDRDETECVALRQDGGVQASFDTERDRGQYAGADVAGKTMAIALKTARSIYRDHMKLKR